MVIDDITERKEAEEKLRKSEQATRELLGALPAAIFVTDAGGRITYYNQAAVELWGRRPELGKDRWSDLARPYCADGHPAKLADCPTEIALRQGRSVRGVEAILERADGTRIPVLPYPTPLRDGTGTIVGVVNMTVDISERQQAEQTLAERNTQLSLAGKAGHIGRFAYDSDTGMMQVSEGYVALHGLPEGTTEIALSQWLADVHPADVERMRALRSEVFRNRQRECNAEYRIVRSDGEVRWIEARSSISYDGDGRPRRIIGVNIDITERKDLEDHKNTLISELDHRVKNMLAIISTVASRTQETSNSMAEFVAALDSRIKSMATTQELLSAGGWQGISLAELVRRELAPYGTRNNTKINGPEVLLKSDAGQAMAMVLHELVTNAAKYGALSKRSGHVAIRWDRRSNGHARSQLVLEWQEIGGPPAVSPGKPSYGSSIIRDLIPYEFGGSVDLVFASDGVRCRLELPAEWICNNCEPDRSSACPTVSG